MAAFLDQPVDCDPNEFEGIFDSDDSNGFETLLARVTSNNNELLFLSPIFNNHISPMCDTIPLSPSYLYENTSLSSHETPCFRGNVNNELPAGMRSYDDDAVAVEVPVPPFRELETPSCITDYSGAPSFSSDQQQQPPPPQGTCVGVVGIVPMFRLPETKNSPHRVPVRHKVTPALSAYNFFFRDERDRILSGGGTLTYNTWSRERQELLLKRHWQQDRSQKRRHVKTHGKINFATLSKSISMRWKQLPESGKEFYREISLRDWDRFRKESSELEAVAAGGVSL